MFGRRRCSRGLWSGRGSLCSGPGGFAGGPSDIMSRKSAIVLLVEGFSGDRGMRLRREGEVEKVPRRELFLPQEGRL